MAQSATISAWFLWPCNRPCLGFYLAMTALVACAIAVGFKTKKDDRRYDHHRFQDQEGRIGGLGAARRNATRPLRGSTAPDDYAIATDFKTKKGGGAGRPRGALAHYPRTKAGVGMGCYP